MLSCPVLAVPQLRVISLKAAAAAAASNVSPATFRPSFFSLFSYHIVSFSDYCAFTSTETRVFPQSRLRSAVLSFFLSKEMVNCSTDCGRAVFFMSTRAKSWLSSYFVPHWPVCLLIISFHVPSEGRV